MALFTAGQAQVCVPLLFFGAVGRLLARHPLLWRRTVLDAPFAAFGAVLIVSAVVSPYRSIAVLSAVSTIVSSVVLFGSFAWLLGQDADVRSTLLRVWALGGPPAALVAMAVGWSAHARAFFPGIPGGVNTFGTTISLANLAALGLAYRTVDRERMCWCGCALLTLMGLLMNESRSAMVGWVAGTAYLSWRELHARPRQLALAVAAGLVVLMVGTWASPSLAARVGVASTDLVADRLEIWRIAARIVESRPLLGSGPGSFPTTFSQQKPAGVEYKLSAHNLWLNAAAEVGFLGLATILWVICAAARAWTKSGRLAPGRDDLRPTISSVGIALLTNQFGDNTLLTMSTITGAWLLLAWLVTPAPDSNELRAARSRLR